VNLATQVAHLGRYRNRDDMDLVFQSQCRRELIEGLAVNEVVALFASSRFTKHAMAPMIPAIAFAITRPKLHMDGKPLTMTTWQRLWEMCAHSVARDGGLDVGLWAYAGYQIEHAHDENARHGMVLDQYDKFLCSFMERSRDPAQENITFVPPHQSKVRDYRISAVLMVQSSVNNIYGVLYGLRFSSKKRCDQWTAVVTNSDGKLALISALHNDDFGGHMYGGLVCMQDSLADILQSVSGKWVELDGHLALQHTDVENLSRMNEAWCFYALMNELPLPTLKEQPMTTKSLARVANLLRQDCAQMHTKSHGVRQNSDQLVDHESDVIAIVNHPDEAAVIHPHEAALIASFVEADFVERNINANVESLLTIEGSDATESFAELPEREPIHILRLTRNPKQCEERLQNGPELEVVRASLSEAGYSSRLPSGAAIFVNPQEYAATMQVIARHTLRPYHIVVSEVFMPLVFEAITSLPCRSKVRVCDHHIIGYVGATTPSGPAVDDIYVVVSTFLTTAGGFRQPQSVVQSTSAAHNSVNPRQYDIEG